MVITIEPATMAGHGVLKGRWRWSVKYPNEYLPEMAGGVVGSYDLAVERAFSRVCRNIRGALDY